MTFKIRLLKTYSGYTMPSYVGNESVFTLESAILQACCDSCSLVFICNGKAVAILKHAEHFIVFDSHSRTIDGLFCENGTSIVLKFKTFTLLTTHLRKLINVDCQYDIHSFCIQKLKKGNHAEHTLLRQGHSKITIPSEYFNTTALTVSDKAGEKRSAAHFLSHDTSLRDRASAMANSLCDKLHFHDHSYAKRKKVQTAIDKNEDMIRVFHNKIAQGPNYICTCCSQLFFSHSVIRFKNAYKLAGIFSTNTVSVGDTEWICNTCHNYLRKNEIPPCSVGNNLAFPNQPEELEMLTELEERLISPRIPFMQIRELPRGGQHGLRGNVVNVPSDVGSTMKVLPRHLDECETIPLKLKRYLAFDSSVLFQQIKSQVVLNALKWLLNNSSSI